MLWPRCRPALWAKTKMGVKAMPNYKTIQDLNAVKDRLDIWMKHHKQPQAYDSGTMTLVEIAEMLADIAKAHEAA